MICDHLNTHFIITTILTKQMSFHPHAGTMFWDIFGNKSTSDNTSQFIVQVYHSVSAIRAKEHGSTNLGADEQVGDAGCILLQLWHPFLAHVLETGRVNHGEADEEDIGHWVGQRPEAVVILLKDDVTELGTIWRGGGWWSGWQDEQTRLFLIWEMILMNYWGVLDMSSKCRRTLTPH